MAEDFLHVPEELLFDIPKRLPSKSLLRFSIVCKSWYSLITSPLFINTHRRTSSLKKHVFTLTHPPRETNYLCSLHTDNAKFDKLLDFRSPFDVDSTRILSICHGLICIYVDKRIPDGQNVYLWNPSIRRFFRVPPPPGHNKWTTTISESGAIGVGFNSETNDYIVIHLNLVRRQAAICKLDIGSWKKANYNESFFAENYINPDAASVQVFLNDTVHWKLLNRFNQSKSVIMTYNVVKDKLGVITVPSSISLKSFYVRVTSYKDSLALVQSTYKQHYVEFSIWVMIEYGVNDSWTKHFTINLNSAIFFKYTGDASLFERLFSKSTRDLIHLKRVDLNYLDYFVQSLTLLNKQGSCNQDLLKY